MFVNFITKRKATRAIKLALEDKKIPASLPRFYRYGTEAGLIWEELNLSAPIRVRFDGTIYIGHATPFESGSYFDRSRTGFQPS